MTISQMLTSILFFYTDFFDHEGQAIVAIVDAGIC